jgi:hypothetical protein
MALKYQFNGLSSARVRTREKKPRQDKTFLHILNPKPKSIEASTRHNDDWIVVKNSLLILLHITIRLPTIKMLICSLNASSLMAKQPQEPDDSLRFFYAARRHRLIAFRE